MFLQKPNTEKICQFVPAQAGLDYTYPDDGATLSLSPFGNIVDHARLESVSGELIFKSVLRYCQQMRLLWGDGWSSDTRD
jgi:hypothetical protein